jgi:hypothetical protein
MCFWSVTPDGIGTYASKFFQGEQRVEPNSHLFAEWEYLQLDSLLDRFSLLFKKFLS